METWVLLFFVCARSTPGCETIEYGHYKTRAECVRVLDRELDRVRKTDRGAGAACKPIER